MTESLCESVHVVETGEYEQRFVFGVYASIDAAVRGIKAAYGPPYIVRWHQVEPGEDFVTLTGDFEAVPDYSIKHRAHFDITEMELGV